MFQLITGGSGSGKSEYAEQQVLLSQESTRIYVATMIPYGEDGRRRVERHRILRREKQFETVECYTDLEQLELPEASVVLLECVSNLVANEMFEPSGAHENTVETVCRGIRHLQGQVHHLIVVSNDIFADGITYDPSTQQYMEYLGQVNRQLADMADQVTEVVCGIPLAIRASR